MREIDLIDTIRKRFVPFSVSSEEFKHCTVQSYHPAAGSAIYYFVSPLMYPPIEMDKLIVVFAKTNKKGHGFEYLGDANKLIKKQEDFDYPNLIKYFPQYIQQIIKDTDSIVFVLLEQVGILHYDIDGPKRYSWDEPVFSYQVLHIEGNKKLVKQFRIS